MPPLNLLFITHYTGRGGGESVQLNLMAALGPRGYRMHLVTPRDGVFNRLARELGVSSYVMPFRGASTLFVPWVYRRFPIARRLARLLTEQQIDLIHSDYHALPFAVGAGQRAGVPVLWNAMGGWFPLRTWQAGFFRDQVARSIAITDTVRRELVRSGQVLAPEQLEIIIPGVDPDQYRPGVVSGDAVRSRIGIGPEVPLVSLIGRFQHVKGQHVFVSMAAKVLQAVPETHFALAGDNVFGVRADEAYKAQVLAMVQADPALQERVHFLGFWPDSREVVAASTVIACTSYAESLGMVVIEAMSMGAAVVSTRGGGPSETVRDGATGFLAEPGNPESFAGHVIALLRDPGLRGRIGEQARAHVIADLSIARYADRFEQVAQEVVAQHRAGH